MLLSLLITAALMVTWHVMRRPSPGGRLAAHSEGAAAGELVQAQPVQPEKASVLLLPWPLLMLWWLIAPLWWVAKRVGPWTWRRRDAHAVVWICAALYILTMAAHLFEAPWPFVALTMAVLAVAARLIVDRAGVLPVQADTVAGALVVLGAWMSAATAWGPTTILNGSWLAITAAVLAAWWLPRDVRAWRHLRMRVRNWSSALPVVLAGIGAAGVVVASRPAVAGNGRVEFPLRLPIGVTRDELNKQAMRKKIESGMHWPEGSIRDIAQDPAHTSSARVVLIWHEGKIQARVVKFAPPKVPASIMEAAWIGVDDDGRDVYVAHYVPGHGMTRGIYGGESGSAKSNLLRLEAWMRAHCDDTLLWIIDLKNDGLTYAALLPRLDRPIATTPEAATRVLEDAAAAIPLRGRLLRPEDNQVLPLGTKRPAILVIGDEVSMLLARKNGNQRPIEAAKRIGQQGRALGVGMELASQYLSKSSLDPDLLPHFPRRYAGRTAKQADSQQILRFWNQLDSTLLPTGAFYHQQSGSSATTLLYTPEVSDQMLTEVAAQTADSAPALEEATASELPHYADRWLDCPDHLLPYCTAEQQVMVHEARARHTSGTLQQEAGKAKAVAAGGKPLRLVVSERIATPADLEVLASEISDRHVRALVAVHLSPGLVSTGQSNAAVAPERGRAWATARRAAWRKRDLIEQPSKGQWRRTAGERELVRGALAAEEEIRAGRAEAGEADAPGGEAPDAGTTSHLGIPAVADSPDLGDSPSSPRWGEGPGAAILTDPETRSGTPTEGHGQ